MWNIFYAACPSSFLAYTLGSPRLPLKPLIPLPLSGCPDLPPTATISYRLTQTTNRFQGTRFANVFLSRHVSRVLLADCSPPASRQSFWDFSRRECLFLAYVGRCTCLLLLHGGTFSSETCGTGDAGKSGDAGSFACSAACTQCLSYVTRVLLFVIHCPISLSLIQK